MQIFFKERKGNEMKKIKILLSIGALFLFSIISINAASSGSYRGPTLYPGGPPVNGPVFNLRSAQSTALVSNSGVYFTELGYLESGFAKGDRAFPIWLYDQDFGNADDQLKTYEGYFRYDYTTLYLIKPMSSIESYDNIIDTNGDAVGELYLKAQLGPVSGDAKNISTELFYYEIVLN